MPFCDPTTDISASQVYAAIADVLDPELDEPLVKLGFIDQVQIAGPDVTVVFKLPTYWCSPNFAYLMAADLRDSVRTLPGVRTVYVALRDHCAEDEINAGINQDRTFAQAFSDESLEDENLEALRLTFLRKGFLTRQDTLIRQMLKAGLDEATISALRLADIAVDEAANHVTIATPQGLTPLPGMGKHATAYIRRGQRLGLLQTNDAPLITDEQGQPLAPGGLQQFLRRSRSIRLTMMFNTSLCTSLFRTRYGHSGTGEAEREGEAI